MNDPLRTWKRRRILSIAGVAIGLAGIAAWAFQPVFDGGPSMPLIDSELRPVRVESESDPLPREPIDASVFRTMLWPLEPVAPGSDIAPDEPAKAAGAEPSPRGSDAGSSLVLIGVLEEREGLRAAIYDAESDKLIIAKGGSSVRTLRVMAISRDGVRLSDDVSTFWLALERGN